MSSSAATKAEASDVVCGWCGVAGVDNIELEDCGGCDLVKYCGYKCRKQHWHWHIAECKKRAQDLHDKKLFKQPERSHLGECPLCFLPMPLDQKKYAYYSCCSKIACKGCIYANVKSSGNFNCPFCRESAPDEEEIVKRKMKMKRIKANDPAAMREMGTECYHKGDYDVAFEYWTKAAELGDAVAHYQLADSYDEGGVVEKDEKKAVYHWEKAAIGGDPEARHNLGCVEEENGNIERSVKHFIIAANLGFEKSMKELWDHYSAGNITKEDLEATLRTHHAAINEMKSPERDAAEKLGIVFLG